MSIASLSFLQSMGFYVNPQGLLELMGVDLVSLAKTSERPIYVFNELKIRENLRAYKKALQDFYPNTSSIFYASKAFFTRAMGAILQQESVGVDVNSEGELFIAEKSGIPPEQILMHGNNKSEIELRKAILLGIKCIVIDSHNELLLVEKLAKELDRKVSILLRINPDVALNIHKANATGTKASKFGFYADQVKIPDYLKAACASGHVIFKGLHFHLGSNILDVSPYTAALEKVAAYMAFLEQHGFKVEELNIGGGFGVPYSDDEDVPSIPNFLKAICEKLIEVCKCHSLDLPELMVEPGRSIVASAGCTLYQVGMIKRGHDGLLYAAINGGMTDNLRPSLYQAEYTGVLANKMTHPDGPSTAYKIVGKCCEAGDVLIENINLPPCETGDIFVVFNTGAYVHSLANTYNKHTLPSIVFVREGESHIVVKEQSLEDLIALDLLPQHLTKILKPDGRDGL